MRALYFHPNPLLKGEGKKCALFLSEIRVELE